MNILKSEQSTQVLVSLAGVAVFLALALHVNSIFFVGAFLSLAIGSAKSGGARRLVLVACFTVVVLVLAYELGKWVAVSGRFEPGMATCAGRAQ